MAGFLPTPNLDPNKPSAVRKVVNVNGMMQVQLVDPSTGQPIVGSPQNYNVIQPEGVASLEDLGLDPGEKESTAPPVPTPVSSSAIPKPITYGEGGRSESPGGVSNDSARNPSNNYGYVNKPGWAGLTNMLPGPIGMAAKAANTAVNLNNVGAINTARGVMGVPELGVKETIGAAVRDRKGFVGNVDIETPQGLTQYSVGLEALTPTGKTTMTPDEVSKRAAANQSDIELSEDQQDSKSKGMIRSFISSLFDDDEEEKVTTKSFPSAPTPARSKSGGFAGGNKAQSSYDGKSYAGTNKGADSPSETGAGRFGGSGLGGGMSPGARSSVDKGKGGLY